jgi:DUF971 family protein
MTTKTTVEQTPGTGVNLADDAAAQEAVGAAALRVVPGGAKEKAQGFMNKVKDFGQAEIRVKHVAYVGAAALALTGYEYLAAKKDWGFRLGMFGKKTAKK